MPIYSKQVIGLSKATDDYAIFRVRTFANSLIIEGRNTWEHFDDLYEKIQEHKRINNIIIDVCDNPGSDPHLAFKLILAIFGKNTALEVKDPVFNPDQKINF